VNGTGTINQFYLTVRASFPIAENLTQPQLSTFSYRFRREVPTGLFLEGEFTQLMGTVNLGDQFQKRTGISEGRALAGAL